MHRSLTEAPVIIGHLMSVKLDMIENHIALSLALVIELPSLKKHTRWLALPRPLKP